MFSKSEIETYLFQVNEELIQMDVKGELYIYGGSVMCLVYSARPSTKDVDAIFEPSNIIRRAISNVAVINGINENWLNDGVKGYVVHHPREILFNWSNLNVYVPDPDYLLAMKTLAARIDGTDKEDIQFLIKELSISTPDEVFEVLEKYYPRKQIKPATQFFVEELFE